MLNLKTITKKELRASSEVERLTAELAIKSVGRDIIFANRDGKFFRRKINKVSETGKTIWVNFPHYKNNLQTGREIFLEDQLKQ